MNENRFKFEGIVLDAKTVLRVTCDGCFFKDREVCINLRTSGAIPECNGRIRNDGRNVVFIPKND